MPKRAHRLCVDGDSYWEGKTATPGATGVTGRRATVSGFEYQFVILQVNHHKLEFAEKIHAQQAVDFLPHAL